MKVKNMKIATILLLAGISVITANQGFAQERAAGGTIEAQVTWTGLSDMAKAAANKADAVNSRVDQVVVCGKKGMVYAPGQAGADTDGCYEPRSAGGISMTTINSSLTGNTNNINAIIACNKANMVFNGTTCVKPLSSLEVSQVRGLGGATATATCPAGTILVGCSGSRHPNFADTCDEKDCGFLGAGPINATTCRTGIDTGGGTQATAWAFCLKSN